MYLIIEKKQGFIFDISQSALLKKFASLIKHNKTAHIIFCLTSQGRRSTFSEGYAPLFTDPWLKKKIPDTIFVPYLWKVLERERKKQRGEEGGGS